MFLAYHSPARPATLLLRDFHAARLSPKQKDVIAIHGKTCPQTHLPLKTSPVSSLIQARERDGGMSIAYIAAETLPRSSSCIIQHACKSYQWTSNHANTSKTLILYRLPCLNIVHAVQRYLSRLKHSRKSIFHRFFCGVEDRVQ